MKHSPNFVYLLKYILCLFFIIYIEDRTLVFNLMFRLILYLIIYKCVNLNIQNNENNANWQKSQCTEYKGRLIDFFQSLNFKPLTHLLFVFSAVSIRIRLYC